MSGLKLSLRGGIWQCVGTVAGKRVRQSTGTGDRSKAEEYRAQIEARIWQRSVYGETAVRTFEEAAVSYLEQGGEGRFLPALLHFFKGRKLSTIAPGDIREAALKIYPNAMPATRNRQGISPAKAVINHGATRGWCQTIVVEPFPVSKSTKNKPVDRLWLDAFLAQCDQDKMQHLAGIVLFMNHTGARRSEAVRLMGDHVDLSKRVAVLAKTKTDEWSVRHLTAELTLRMAALSPQPGEPVFRYTDPAAVNRAIARVCDRARIEKRSTHGAGRHSFGTNAMKAGATVKAAMEAGGWKSPSLFLRTYVHESTAGKDVAAILDAQSGPVGTDVAQSEKRKGYRFGKKAKS